MDKRVVITGMGVISPVGNDVNTFWKNLCDGYCGIEVIESEDTEQLPVRIAGKVKEFHAEDYGMDKPFIRKQDLFTQFGVAAAYQAVKQSGLVSTGEGQNIDPLRFGVYFGSGIGGFATQYREMAKMIDDPSGQWISPLFIPTMISNIAAGQIAILNHAEGPCLDIVTACATSTNAMGEAYRAIKHGYADAIITGGSENATIPIGIAGFANLKALSRSTDPKYASLPFNANRAGFVMGDGSAALILEEYEHAKARGAKIYAEIVGVGMTSDAYHMTAPDPEGKGAERVMRLAINDAGIEPEQVDFVNTHGTSTPLGDVTELNAIKRVFGEHVYEMNLDSTKSMTGHLIGATGAVEALACVMALKDGIIPPTINHDPEDADENIDYRINFTFDKAQKRDIRYALSNTFGFGGHNACLVFRKWEE